MLALPLLLLRCLKLFCNRILLMVNVQNETASVDSLPCEVNNYKLFHLFIPHPCNVTFMLLLCNLVF